MSLSKGYLATLKNQKVTFKVVNKVICFCRRKKVKSSKKFCCSLYYV